MRAIVTGATGFAGSHLCDLLVKHGVEVVGTFRFAPENPVPGAVKLRKCDIRDATRLRELVGEAHPDVLFHLAGMASVPDAESSPRTAFETNVLGTLNAMDAVRSSAPESKVIAISSSEVYGRTPADELPIAERTVPAPNSVYAVTKLAAEHLVRIHAERHGLRVVVLRPFNHLGPRQSDKFACSNFARQIAEIETRSGTGRLEAGNLAARRDLTDVRDMVAAYWLAALELDDPGPYNVCSGRAYAIQEVLDGLLAASPEHIEVVTDAERLRDGEAAAICGDSSRFRDATGWQPKIELARSLVDTLDCWRARLRSASVAPDC